jgi:hypothetical protein
MKSKNYPPTPELNKMKLVSGKSQAIGEFVDIFLSGKGFSIGQPHKHTSSCPGWEDDDGVVKRVRGTTNDCGLQTEEFVSCPIRLENLLAEFFEIDLAKCESERRAILEYLQTT